MPQKRRMIALPFSISLPLSVLFQLANLLPGDTEIAGCDWDVTRGAFVIILYSEKFPPVEEGVNLPDMILHVMRDNSTGEAQDFLKKVEVYLGQDRYLLKEYLLIGV